MLGNAGRQEENRRRRHRCVWSDGQGPPWTGTSQKGLKTTALCDALSPGVGLWSPRGTTSLAPAPPPVKKRLSEVCNFCIHELFMKSNKVVVFLHWCSPS